MMKFLHNWIALLFFSTSLTLTAGQAMAADAASSDEWQFSAELYGFLLDVETTSTSGDTMELKFDDLLDNMDFYFSGALTARKNKFLLMADFFYYKGSTDADITARDTTGITADVKVDVDADINKNTFLTLSGGYNLLQTEKASMDVLLGARYFKLDLEVDADAVAELTLPQIGSPKLILPLPSRTAVRRAADELSVNGDVWDVVVGVRGDVKLNNDWYLTYLADYGGGDSDHTWQAYGAVGYKFGWGDLTVGYRHLEYEFDDTDFISEMEYDGPMIGAKFYF